MKPVAVQAVKFGEFYSGDCYIIFYKYKENGGRGKEASIIYFWIVSLTELSHAPTLIIQAEFDTFTIPFLTITAHREHTAQPMSVGQQLPLL